MFSTLLVFSFCSRPKITDSETLKEKLRRLYKDHHQYTYRDSHYVMYNQADCRDGKINMMYDTYKYPWACNQKVLPDQRLYNTEHIIPQSFFKKEYPMVSDLHHLFSCPAKLNNLRGSLPYKEFDYSECSMWCRNQKCESREDIPSNPELYSCMNKDKNAWMPRTEDRGMVARAIFYFMTMYDGVPIEKMGDLETLKKWNSLYPPLEFEKGRNDNLNETQGNRNPYIDDPSLVDQVFP